MNSVLQPEVEVLSIEPEGWCAECHRFRPVYSVLVHLSDQPADIRDICGRCVEAIETGYLDA